MNIKKNMKYPMSSNKGGGWDGLFTSWGKSGEKWIAGLVPEYIDSLPRDPRKNKQGHQQYIYKSNGKDYKLIAHGISDRDFVYSVDKSFMDPKRKRACGYWTKGAKNW